MKPEVVVGENEFPYIEVKGYEELGVDRNKIRALARSLLENNPVIIGNTFIPRSRELKTADSLKPIAKKLNLLLSSVLKAAKEKA